jgi:hypothetical protein
VRAGNALECFVNGKRVSAASKTLEWQQLRIAPGSPWQSPYVLRLMGSVRRDCLDHVIVLKREAA